ncbi:MAG: S53 family peptidase [Fimbriimonadaceae bacterium]
MAITAAAGAQGPSGLQVTVPQITPPAIVNASLAVGPADAARVLHLALSLRAADPAGLQAAADAASDPASPLYGHYLTPQEVGVRYGQSASDVKALVGFLESQGFHVKLVAPNHMSILADATVAQAESAFSTRIVNYHAFMPEPFGKSDFYAFDLVKIPATFAPMLLTLTGLENYEVPQALHHLAKQATSPINVNQTRLLYDTAPLFSAGFQGIGRTVAISNWDGFRLSNVNLLYATYALPTPSGGVGSNIRVVQVDGGSGAGPAGGEGDLDIQMELGGAPLANLVIYDGDINSLDLISVLTQEGSDNRADIISESWEWTGSDAFYQAAHNQHLAMTLQGITYMSAAGDTGTTFREIYPHIDPEVLSVGGTIATIAAAGNRVNEVAWPGGGGGWNPISEPFNSLPSWQRGSTVPTSVPFRLIPDVAFNAAGPNGAFSFYLGGALASGDGTSFASPVCAGCLAIAEQKLVSLGALPVTGNGKQRLGRVQDLIYKQNGRADVYFDITSGSNGMLPDGSTSNAKRGWDFTTGWGPIDFAAFVRAYPIIALQYVTPIAVSIYAGQGQGAQGTVGNLASIDGNYYSVNSVSLPPLGQVAATQMTFQPGTSITGASLKLIGKSSSPSTNFVYIQNATTLRYDLINTTAYSSSPTTLTIPINNVAQYVNSRGRIVVVTRAVVPNRQGGGPFTVSYDAAQLLESGPA